MLVAMGVRMCFAILERESYNAYVKKTCTILINKKVDLSGWDIVPIN